jgi:exonuclease VII small subunit
MLKLLRNFSKGVRPAEHLSSDFSGTELAQSLEEYSTAMELIKSSNWTMAELELQRCLEIIKNSGQSEETSYNFILTRIALMQRAQSKFNQCEKTLEQIVRNYKNHDKKYPNQLEKAYETLFKQYLSTNVTKALKLGEYLLKNENQLTRNTLKDIKFYFGVLFM